tara:strand:+ start:1997 stop:3385 length:1389 start_codon:yes stop_codon:yes gene_type:complete
MAYRKPDLQTLPRINNINRAPNTVKDGSGQHLHPLLTTDGHQVVNVANAITTTAGDLKARTDIADANTSTNILCDAQGHLKVDVENQPVADLKARTTIADANTSTNLLCDAQGHLKVDEKNSSQLRKTFTEGQDPSNDLGNNATVTTGFSVMGGCDNVNGNFSQINPLRVNTDGKVGLFATTGDIADLRNVSNSKSVATLSNEINDKLTHGGVNLADLTTDIKNSITDTTQKTQLLGNSAVDGSGTQKHLLADNDGHLQVDILNHPLADGKARTDIADANTSIFLKCSASGSLNVKQDDHASVTVQGVSDQANPFGTKKPLLIDTAGKLLTSDAQLTSGGISIAQLTDSIKTFISDATKTGGTITIADPFVSGTSSSSVDVGADRTSIFVYTDGMSGSHGGFVLQGSQDNSNFYNLKTLSPQTLNSLVNISGGGTFGYRYYRLHNQGANVTVTNPHYNAYNN